MRSNPDPPPSLSLTARPNLSAQLARQVRELIQREGLQPGDRLPAAKTLAARFDVATPTLREALRRLQATGVIDIKHGSGIYVRRNHERLMLANPSLDGLETETIPHLLDARLLIEPHVAELAARHASAADLTAMERLLATAARGLDDDLLLHDTNMAFHATLARASGNVILAQMVESLNELHTSEQMVILFLFNDRARDHDDHVELLAAIRRHDAPAAGERMRRHLEDVKTVVTRRLVTAATSPNGTLAPPEPGWPAVIALSPLHGATARTNESSGR